MKTIFKSLTFFIIAVIILILLYILGIYIIFSIPDKTEDFKTDYGDTFRIYYDGFKAKTVITDISNNHSSFDIIVRDKVEKNDMIGLANDDDLKVYKVKNIIFYDEGNGFEIFNSNTENEKVISLAKDNLTVKEFYHIIDEK